MRYNQIFVTIAVGALFFTSVSAPVAAHILKTDGDIGGVIHLNPDDDPYIHEKTEGGIEIKDKSGKLRAVDCNCEIVISQAGAEIYRQAANTVQQDAAVVANFSYTFPAKDIYTISIIGKPRTAGKFEEFELKYDFRITRELNGTSSPIGVTTIIGGAIIMITIALIAYSILRSQQKLRN